MGNRFHACALAQGNGKEKDVKFISCSMSATNPTSYLKLMQVRIYEKLCVFQSEYGCLERGFLGQSLTFPQNLFPKYKASTLCLFKFF